MYFGVAFSFVTTPPPPQKIFAIRRGVLGTAYKVNCKSTKRAYGFFSNKLLFICLVEWSNLIKHNINVIVLSFLMSYVQVNYLFNVNN